MIKKQEMKKIVSAVPTAHVAPKATPTAFEERLNAALRNFKKSVLDEVREKLQSLEAKVEAATPDAFLTRKEAAAFMKCNLVTLWRLEKAKALRPTRVGKKVYYLLSEVTNFMKEGGAK